MTAQSPHSYRNHYPHRPPPCLTGSSGTQSPPPPWHPSMPPGGGCWLPACNQRTSSALPRGQTTLPKAAAEGLPAPPPRWPPPAPRRAYTAARRGPRGHPPCGQPQRLPGPQAHASSPKLPQAVYAWHRKWKGRHSCRRYRHHRHAPASRASGMRGGGNCRRRPGCRRRHRGRQGRKMYRP